jgi:hypothetical protein
MAAINYDPWYDETPASIGRNTTTVQWGYHMHHIIQKVRKNNVGEGNRQRQWPNMIMADDHHVLS